MSTENPVSVTVTAYLTRNPGVQLSMSKLLAAVKAKHKSATVPYLINVWRVNRSKGVKQSEVLRDDMIVGQFTRKVRAGAKPKAAKTAKPKAAKKPAARKAAGPKKKSAPEPSGKAAATSAPAKLATAKSAKVPRVSKAKPDASEVPDISDILNGL